MLQNSQPSNNCSNEAAGIVFSEKPNTDSGPKIEALLDMKPFERLINFLSLTRIGQCSRLYFTQCRTHYHGDKATRCRALGCHLQFRKRPLYSTDQTSEMADKVSMTPQAFSRYFKTKRAKLIQFVTEYRVTHACKLLAEELEHYRRLL